MPRRVSAEAARRQAAELERNRRQYAEHIANARELWEIRPPHSRKFGQFTEEWAHACDKAFVRAMFYNAIELLFTTAQARDLEAYVRRHGRDRNEVIAEILNLGIKAHPALKEATVERAVARRRLAKPSEHAGAAS
jgi:hypothetical protein